MAISHKFIEGAMCIRFYDKIRIDIQSLLQSFVKRTLFAKY